MNRRSFLTRLASGLIGVSLVDMEWVPTPVSSTLALPSQRAMPDLYTATAEVLRRMAEMYPGFRGRYEVGDAALGRRPWMTQQLAIDVMSEDGSVDGPTCLAPIADSLMRAITHRQMVRFGALPLPSGIADGAVAVDEVTGIALRGLRIFDIDAAHFGADPHWMYRFDVVGGA